MNKKRLLREIALQLQFAHDDFEKNRKENKSDNLLDIKLDKIDNLSDEFISTLLHILNVNNLRFCLIVDLNENDEHIIKMSFVSNGKMFDSLIDLKEFNCEYVLHNGLLNLGVYTNY